MRKDIENYKTMVIKSDICSVETDSPENLKQV